jgi:hypothetical protein
VVPSIKPIIVYAMGLSVLRNRIIFIWIWIQIRIRIRIFLWIRIWIRQKLSYSIGFEFGFRFGLLLLHQFKKQRRMRWALRTRSDVLKFVGPNILPISDTNVLLMIFSRPFVSNTYPLFHPHSRCHSCTQYL